MNRTSTQKKPLNFLNLEKGCAIQGQVRTVIYNDKETKDETEINNHIYSFFNYLYKGTLSISFPKHTKEKSKILDGGITEKELLIALQRMENNKSPGKTINHQEMTG